MRELEKRGGIPTPVAVRGPDLPRDPAPESLLRRVTTLRTAAERVAPMEGPMDLAPYGPPRVDPSTLDSGCAKQATLKCGRVRQEGDRVATGGQQAGGRRTTGKRQERGREAIRSDGARQGAKSAGKATARRHAGNRRATGERGDLSLLRVIPLFSASVMLEEKTLEKGSGIGRPKCDTREETLEMDMSSPLAAPTRQSCLCGTCGRRSVEVSGSPRWIKLKSGRSMGAGPAVGNTDYGRSERGRSGAPAA